jgi:glycosyltransferase involved in cell wall biosynthesis
VINTNLKTHFSIVIPVYNRAKLVTKAISSVLNQKIENFELIVVDDSSTDNTLDEVKKIEDSRIRMVLLPENGGNAKARNEGWKSAKGDWIVYLDSDDWLEPTYLENLCKAIESDPIAEFFWSGVRFVSEKGAILKEETWHPRSELPGDTFFDELRIGTNCGVAFRRDLLVEFKGFNEDFKASVDREFFLRISRTKHGKGIQEILVNCLLGNHESVRKNYMSQAEAYTNLVKLYSKEIEAKPSRKKWWYHKSMWLALYNSDFTQARYFMKQIGYPLKSILLYSIFFIFPLEVAKTLHKKLA